MGGGRRSEAAPLATVDEEQSYSNNITSSLCSRCFPWLNLTAISALTVAVIFLFLQLQMVTYSVAQEELQIKKLQNQLSSQQAQTQDLDEKVTEEHDLTILHMAGTFTLLSGLITMFHMSMHLRNFHEPFVQRKILAILWMCPIYGVTSWLSLVWYPAEGYLSILKDFYEAYVIYQFLSFLIAVLGRGDREVVVNVLARHADHLDAPTQCLSRCYHPHPSTSPHAKAQAVLLECQMMAMQFVFCRPATSIASFVFVTLAQVEESQDDDDATEETSKWAYFVSPLFLIAVIQSISVFFAFSGMLKFYHAVRDDLAWCSPFPKFLAIKGVVFMTFWQGLVISILVHLNEGGGRWDSDSNKMNPREKAMMMQNVLICLEMLLFSLAHWCVFPVEEWAPDYKPREYAKPGLGFKDFVEDISYIAESHKQSKNARRTPTNGDDLTVSTIGDRDGPLVARDEEQANMSLSESSLDSGRIA